MAATPAPDARDTQAGRVATVDGPSALLVLSIALLGMGGTVFVARRTGSHARGMR
jgi:hypothetical protein